MPPCAKFLRISSNIGEGAKLKNLNLYATLFASFFKIGAFTFGGGYAMVPMIQRETVENHGWLKDDEILDMLAIAESTPGPIAINSATFVGYRVAGTLGAASATLGTVLPSFIIIAILSQFITHYTEIRWLAWMFDGIRAGVAVLIVNAVIKFFKQCPHTGFVWSIMIPCFIATALFDVDVILLLAIAGIVGILRQIWIVKKGDKKS